MNGSATTGLIYYKVNSDGRAKILPKIETKNNSVESRTTAFLRAYGHDYKQRAANSRGIKVEVLTCIARADTHLGYALKSTNNVGNVGNNDRGDTVHFETLDSGIRAIAYTLENKYLGNKQTIGDLSYAGNCTIDCDKVYATSNSNWQNNVLNCLSLIYLQQIGPDFIFKK